MTLAKLIDAHVVFVFFGHLWSANGLGTDEPVGGGESPTNHWLTMDFRAQTNHTMVKLQISFTTSKMLRDKPKQTFKVIRSCELRVFAVEDGVGCFQFLELIFH